jgi:hypothetical protein
MDNGILDIANLYAKGLAGVDSRRSQWLEKYKEVSSHLKEIATYLNEHAAYKPGYFVDTSYAYNEEINGTCAKIPSVTFRSGVMPMNVSFKSASAEKKEYTEAGFHLTFMPTITGQVLVLLLPHSTSLDKEKPEEIHLAVVDNPSALTMNDLDTIIQKAMKMAFYSSFTGMVELQEQEIHKVQPKHTPIGFKRHDSTEKVK